MNESAWIPAIQARHIFTVGFSSLYTPYSTTKVPLKEFSTQFSPFPSHHHDQGSGHTHFCPLWLQWPLLSLATVLFIQGVFHTAIRINFHEQESYDTLHVHTGQSSSALAWLLRPVKILSSSSSSHLSLLHSLPYIYSLARWNCSSSTALPPSISVCLCF
jgi:hypothetical protein